MLGEVGGAGRLLPLRALLGGKEAGAGPLSSSCRPQAQGDPWARPSQGAPTLGRGDRAWG